MSLTLKMLLINLTEGVHARTSLKSPPFDFWNCPNSTLHIQHCKLSVEVFETCVKDKISRVECFEQKRMKLSGGANVLGQIKISD